MQIPISVQGHAGRTLRCTLLVGMLHVRRTRNRLHLTNVALGGNREAQSMFANSSSWEDKLFPAIERALTLMGRDDKLSGRML